MHYYISEKKRILYESSKRHKFLDLFYCYIMKEDQKDVINTDNKHETIMAATIAVA